LPFCCRLLEGLGPRRPPNPSNHPRSAAMPGAPAAPSETGSELALTGLEEPSGRYLLELEATGVAEGPGSWYGGARPPAGGTCRWGRRACKLRGVSARARARARGPQAYLELCGLVCAAGPGSTGSQARPVAFGRSPFDPPGSVRSGGRGPSSSTLRETLFAGVRSRNCALALHSRTAD